jgi:hypothetical protein
MEPLEAELRRDWERWRATGTPGPAGYESFPATDSGVRPDGDYTGRRQAQRPSARQEYLYETAAQRVPRPGGPSPLSGPMPGLIPPATSGWQQPPARPFNDPRPSAEYYGDNSGYGGNDRGYSSANGYNSGGYPHDYRGGDPRYTSGNGYNGSGYAYDYGTSDRGYGGGAYDAGSYGTDSYKTGSYGTGSYGTGAQARGRQPNVMVAGAPSPWQTQANSWAARSRGQTQPAWAGPASRGYPVPQGYPAPQVYDSRQGIMESPDGAPASMVARILSDADYQAAAITAITELASQRAALVTRQGLFEAAQVRDAAKREADEITQRAAMRASAVREAAELEAAETREAVTLMQAELAELATRITSTLPHPVLPRPAEASRRRA